MRYNSYSYGKELNDEQIKELKKSINSMFIDFLENAEFKEYKTYRTQVVYVYTYNNKDYSITTTAMKGNSNLYDFLSSTLFYTAKGFYDAKYKLSKTIKNEVVKNNKIKAKKVREEMLKISAKYEADVKNDVKKFIKDEFKREIRIFCKKIQKKVNLDRLESQDLVIRCLKETQMEDLFK